MTQVLVKIESQKFMKYLECHTLEMDIDVDSYLLSSLVFDFMGFSL